MKKFLAVILAAAMMLALVACGGGNKNTSSGGDKPANTTDTQAPDKDEAPADTDEPADSEEPADQEGETEQTPADPSTIVMWYGGNYYPDKETYATLHLPQGAYFDEDDYEEYVEDGYVYSFSVYDDEREYTAYSEDHKSRDTYSEELIGYSLLQQLYFDGEVLEATAEEYESWSQTVTDLGFQWEGKDVILIETRSTLVGYWEQVDVFVGVEYEFPYWKAKDNGGIEENLISLGLVGFHMYSTGFEDLTLDQCAWIAAQLFGVDTGKDWPAAEEAVDTEPAPAPDVDVSVLYGTWIDPESDWGDTFVFNPDGIGVLVSGPQFPYTYTVSGSTLTITYDDGDEEVFQVIVTDGVPTLIDNFGDEIKLEKSDEEVEIKNNDALAAALLGYWLDEAAGCNESFTFYEDERGVYTWKEETYEFSYTLSSSESILDIRYDDGDRSTFYVEIDGDTMILDRDWELIRQ